LSPLTRGRFKFSRIKSGFGALANWPEASHEIQRFFSVFDPLQPEEVSADFTEPHLQQQRRRVVILTVKMTFSPVP
jgi:hypothetical protein